MKGIFKYEDFTKVSQGCLDAFSEQLGITALLHAINEILKSGLESYQCVNGIQLLPVNRFGFMVMASAVCQAMYEEAEINARSLRALEIIDTNKELLHKGKKFESRINAIQSWRAFWGLWDTTFSLEAIYKQV
jgi:hypothetical protein